MFSFLLDFLLNFGSYSWISFKVSCYLFDLTRFKKVLEWRSVQSRVKLSRVSITNEYQCIELSSRDYFWDYYRLQVYSLLYRQSWKLSISFNLTYNFFFLTKVFKSFSFEIFSFFFFFLQRFKYALGIFFS